MTSAGEAEIEVTVPQLNVVPVIKADPASGAVVLHWSTTETFVVVRAVVLKFAVPAQVAVMSVDEPESEIV
jgi:hypothetical protein